MSSNLRNKKNKILYISTFSSLKGGGQKSLFLLLERLNRKKIFPILLCPSEGDFPEKAAQLGIEKIILKMESLKGLNLFAIAAAIWKLRKLIKKRKVDLIHTDSPRTTLYASIISRWTGRPLIWHVRVSTGEPYFYERFLYSLSSKIIAVSEACQKRFIGFPGANQKVRVIYNGVDTQEFNPEIDRQAFREEIKIGKEEILVGMVGRVSPSKGCEDFLNAARQVVDKNSKIKFVIVGKGEDDYQNYLKNLVHRFGIDKHIQILTFRDDIRSVLAGLDILVNASRDSEREGFSRVIIEAMSVSIPVIATRVGGNSEAVEDPSSGILIPLENPARLAEAILELAGDEEKRGKLGLKARERVKSLFTIEDNVRKTEEIYDELLGLKSKELISWSIS